MRSELRFLLMLSCLLVALVACKQENSYVPPPPPEVTVAHPEQQKVTLYMELTGNTAAVSQVDLEARVPGFLDQIGYKDGDLVKKGQMLFVIEPPPYQAQVDVAQATVAAEQAQLLQAQLEFARQQTLVRQDVAAQAKLDDARAKRDSAEAGLQQAQANLEIARINLGYTRVEAPFDGVVTAHLADIGALVGEGMPTKLATIVQQDPIYVYCNVSEQDVLRIRAMLAKRGVTLAELGPVPFEVGLQTEQGYPHRGMLDYAAPEVDPGTGTLTIRGVFDNKQRQLLPGLFVRVRVPVQRDVEAMLVPDVALGTDQRGRYALVVGTDDVVEQRVVETGQLVGDRRIVISGLAADDRVVVGGIQKALPGAKVVPRSPAPAPAAKTGS
jgi:RND family efflux transporter MFP subunit